MKELAAALNHAGSYKYGEQRQWVRTGCSSLPLNTMFPKQAAQAPRTCSQWALPRPPSTGLLMLPQGRGCSHRADHSDRDAQIRVCEGSHGTYTDLHSLSPAHPSPDTQQRTESMPAPQDSETWSLQAPQIFKRHSSHRCRDWLWMKLHDRAACRDLTVFSCRHCTYHQLSWAIHR